MVSRLVQTFENGEVVSERYIDMSWKHIRRIRDNELESCDWRFMSDQSPSQEWIDYRQFLRDLPQNHYDETDNEGDPPNFGANNAADALNEYEIPE